MAHNNSAPHSSTGIATTSSGSKANKQQHFMNKILAHSTSLLANDSYMAGMSSDSELTSASSSNRHHHRPYSSQSRAYHAHPTPRTSQAFSRMSHHSDPVGSSCGNVNNNSYMPNASAASGADKVGVGAPISSSSQQHHHQQQQQHQAPTGAHLSHQGSVSSSGSGSASVPPPAAMGHYLPAESPMLMHQQQALPRATTSRQLPQRPFKQSMSIDHHSAGQYHHQQLQLQQQQQHSPFVHPTLAAANHHHHHLASVPASSSQYPYESLSDTNGASVAYQPTGTRSYPSSSAGAEPTLGLAQQQTRYERQRNLMLEMEMLDKRTAAVNLNADNELLATSGCQLAVQGSPASAAMGQQQATSASASATFAASQASQAGLLQSSVGRQMGPNQAAAGVGSMAVDRHLGHHQLEQYPPTETPTMGAEQQQQYLPTSSQQHLLQQQQQQQQQNDLYSPHHIAATSSADWLPPIGPPYTSHHLPPTRTGGGGVGVESQPQLQTASMDHYQSSIGQQQQQRSHHFSPARSAHFNEHFRCSSLAYPGGSGDGSPVRANLGGYEPLPNQQLGASYHHHHHQPARNTNELHNEVPYHHQYAKEQQQATYNVNHQAARNQLELQHQSHSHESTSQQPQQRHYSAANNFNHSARSAASVLASPMQGPTNQQQQQQQPIQKPKLQHQLSSSSSNSQSGSLKSSNLDISKSLASSSAASTDQLPQRPPPLAHLQQQASASYGADQQQQQQHHRHGPPRRGYASVASSLAGSNLALNELSLDSAASQPTSHGGLAASQATGKRSALRANSPSSAYAATNEATTSASASAAHNKHHHLSSSYSRDMGAGGGGRVAGSGVGGAGAGSRSESSTGLPNGQPSSQNNSSLTKKSNSATQLSMTGTKKRLGFRKKQVTSFSVYRSEEVAPLEARHLVKQGSSVSEGESSLSGDSSSRSWSNSNFKQATQEELASMSFIDGLGKGQMISRQGLASPYLGDIQLSLCDRRGNLEVEVIRARNLQAKANKILPLTYVKLYLVKNRKCLAKAKTTLCNKRTLDPLFQQQLVFHEDYHGSILQSIVWGNFGKMDKKNFMGIAQISIDDLELNDTVISWYKLFLPSSLQTLPSKSLRHTLLSNSTESFTNTNQNS